MPGIKCEVKTLSDPSKKKIYTVDKARPADKLDPAHVFLCKHLRGFKIWNYKLRITACESPCNLDEDWLSINANKLQYAACNKTTPFTVHCKV